jgi:hypothetical protein
MGCGRRKSAPIEHDRMAAEIIRKRTDEERNLGGRRRRQTHVVNTMVQTPTALLCRLGRDSRGRKPADDRGIFQSETFRSEEPYVNSTSTVPWELEGASPPSTRRAL